MHISAATTRRQCASYVRGPLQGDADAQFKVGVMYDQGWGVPQNYTLALA
jgi:TPR repeat protein